MTNNQINQITIIMSKKLMYAIMALAATTAMTSCEDEDLKKVYTEGVSLDSPYIFSEGYQDEIVHPYDLPLPSPTGWVW